MKLKCLWLDDLRPTPSGWDRARSVNEAIAMMCSDEYTHVSMDQQSPQETSMGLTSDTNRSKPLQAYKESLYDMDRTRGSG